MTSGAHCCQLHPRVAEQHVSASQSGVCIETGGFPSAARKREYGPLSMRHSRPWSVSQYVRCIALCHAVCIMRHALCLRLSPSFYLQSNIDIPAPSIIGAVTFT